MAILVWRRGVIEDPGQRLLAALEVAEKKIVSQRGLEEAHGSSPSIPLSSVQLEMAQTPIFNDQNRRPNLADAARRFANTVPITLRYTDFFQPRPGRTYLVVGSEVGKATLLSLHSKHSPSLNDLDNSDPLLVKGVSPQTVDQFAEDLPLLVLEALELLCARLDPKYDGLAEAIDTFMKDNRHAFSIRPQLVSSGPNVDYVIPAHRAIVDVLSTVGVIDFSKLWTVFEAVASYEADCREHLIDIRLSFTQLAISTSATR